MSETWKEVESITLSNGDVISAGSIVETSWSGYYRVSKIEKLTNPLNGYTRTKFTVSLACRKGKAPKRKASNKTTYYVYKAVSPQDIDKAKEDAIKMFDNTKSVLFPNASSEVAACPEEDDLFLKPLSGLLRS